MWEQHRAHMQPTISTSVGALTLLAALLVLAYPERRVLTWFEVMTDGAMPARMGNKAQDVLSEQWRDSFHRPDLSQGHKEVLELMSAYLKRSNSSTLVEIAAGAGAAPVLWAEELRRDPQHSDLSVILTDLQPNPDSWQRLRTRNGKHVGYLNLSLIHI
eukprot:TRINITY_DN50081_c0_g1_i1.p1 TRINITY_DN50081_c0_g1~~TRINITY_DN50081_c0_g1_i1.p1  ORF type:complete len:159 (+),score=32.55 TRINITY_DN50081_c0_g1_i1:100-576(+)